MKYVISVHRKGWALFEVDDDGHERLISIHRTMIAAEYALEDHYKSIANGVSL